MMKVAIIALMLAIAALGLGGFATFAALNDDETPPIAAEPTWSSEECANARAVLSGSDGSYVSIRGATWFLISAFIMPTYKRL